MEIEDIPIRDNHVHVWKEIPLDETVAFHKSIMKRFNYTSITLLGLNEQGNVPPTTSIMDNLKILYMKKLIPNKIYGYAGLHLKKGIQKCNASDLLGQAEMYRDAGFDGIKLFFSGEMYELGFPLISYRVFEPFFQFMEEKEFPIIMHLGGPEICWRELSEIPESQRMWHVTSCYSHPFDYFRDFLTMIEYVGRILHPAAEAFYS